MNTGEIYDKEDIYHKEDVYGEAFDRYEKVLRTWFVAYGIGATILFMTQEKLRATLLCHHLRAWVVGLFLVGVLVQEIVSAFYEMCRWDLYYDEAQKNEGERDERCPCLLDISKWVERSHLIGVSIDSLTIGLFAAATIMAFRIVIP